MIDSYFEFNVERFFGDYKQKKNTLERLKNEKESVPDEFSTDWSNERVSGGQASDPTEQKVFRRLRIDEKIADNERYFKAYDLIMSELTTEERRIVEEYYIKHGGSYAVNRLSREFCCEQSKVYAMIKQTKRHIKEVAQWI